MNQICVTNLAIVRGKTVPCLSPLMQKCLNLNSGFVYSKALFSDHPHQFTAPPGFWTGSNDFSGLKCECYRIRTILRKGCFSFIGQEGQTCLGRNSNVLIMSEHGLKYCASRADTEKFRRLGEKIRWMHFWQNECTLPLE